MRKVVRSLVWKDPVERDEAAKNFKHVRQDRLLNMRKTETAVLEFTMNFFQQSGEAPQFKTVYDNFEQAKDTEAVTYLEEMDQESFYAGASFETLFEKEVDDQTIQHLAETCKTALKIATVGIKIGQQTVQGVDEAVAHIMSNARTKPKLKSGIVATSMRKSSADLDKLYAERKANPHTAYGILTGYGLIDSSTSGIRKKQLYFHAGFGGHLKSTQMMNMIVNSVVNGWNELLFTSEMPAEDVQNLIIAIHSGNPKFNGVGRPLNSHRLLLGALRTEEETFYKLVKDDFANNPLHGSVRVVDSGEFTTFGSVMQRTIQEDQEEEVDGLWCDYITKLPVDPKYRGMDITSARNETIADAKRFAMGFRGGIGLPVRSPFQINREGYKRARDNEGRMDMTALAQYNAVEREADVISYIFYDDEQKATSEPLNGLLKSRWGQVKSDPVPLYIDPDCRRIHDMTAGMTPQAGYAPTGGGRPTEDVEL